MSDKFLARYLPHLQCTGRGRPTALSPLQMLWNNPLYPPGLVSDTTSGWIATKRALRSLTTWLAHSKKKNCDVCKHPYSFTKGEPVLLSQGRFTMSISLCSGYALKATHYSRDQAPYSTSSIRFPFFIERSDCRCDMARSFALGNGVGMADVFFPRGLYVRLPHLRVLIMTD